MPPVREGGLWHTTGEDSSSAGWSGTGAELELPHGEHLYDVAPALPRPSREVGERGIAPPTGPAGGAMHRRRDDMASPTAGGAGQCAADGAGQNSASRTGRTVSAPQLLL